MAMETDFATGPYKMEAKMEKWANEEDWLAGLDPIVETSVSWHEQDGTEITDPDRIAELEAIIAKE